MDHRHIIANMVARVAQCRRLGAAMTDMRTATALREMADQIEADIQRLKTEDAAGNAPGGDRPDASNNIS